MYRDYYGLLEKPFSLTPDPKFFFGSAGHAEARELLCYGVREREGFMCFIGAAGTGKTTMLRTALDSLGDDVVTAFVLNPNLSEEDLLRIILVDFGVIPPAELDSDVARALGKVEMLEYLNGFLLELSMQGRTAVLVIDEAQNLPLHIMEQIRLLSNLETSKQKLLQIVLAGQLGLRRLLETPELSQLAQRVSVRYRMPSFDVSNVGRYIEHRLRVAGNCDEIVFEPEAYVRIHRYSEGVPRLVNLLADRALIAGFAQQTRTITTAMVDQAASTLELGGDHPTPVERDTAPVAQHPQPAAAPGTLERPRTITLDASSRPQSQRSAAVGADNGFRPWQAVAGVAIALAMTVGGYAGWQRQQVPQLPTPTDLRAEGSLSAVDGNEQFGTGGPAVDLARPQAPFTIYLSSYRNPADATLVGLRQEIESAGHLSFLVEADVPGQGTLYRLTVGEYADRGVAAAAAAQLLELLGLDHAEAVDVSDVAGSKQ